MIFTHVCIQTGDIEANDGGRKSPGSGPTPSSGDPAATGGDPTPSSGDPTATGGDPTATGGDLTATDGDPAAIGVIQGTHPDSSLPTRAPDVAPLIKKFTCFGYQITSGMVSIIHLHNSHSSSSSPSPYVERRGLETCITCSKNAVVTHLCMYSCVL